MFLFKCVYHSLCRNSTFLPLFLFFLFQTCFAPGWSCLFKMVRSSFLLFEWFLHKYLPSNHFRPNTWVKTSKDTPMSWSTTRTWTSHPSHTWLRTWSPTASTLSGSPVTAARARLTGHPGLNCTPKKEVSLLSRDMFVFSKRWFTPSEVSLRLSGYWF